MQARHNLKQQLATIPDQHLYSCSPAFTASVQAKRKGLMPPLPLATWRHNASLAAARCTKPAACRPADLM